jgi:hypothetical protein
MDTQHRIVIVDSTPSTTKLEIDTTRLAEKKRKHRRMSIIYIIITINEICVFFP